MCKQRINFESQASQAQRHLCLQIVAYLSGPQRRCLKCLTQIANVSQKGFLYSPLCPSLTHSLCLFLFAKSLENLLEFEFQKRNRRIEMCRHLNPTHLSPIALPLLAKYQCVLAFFGLPNTLTQALTCRTYKYKTVNPF